MRKKPPPEAAPAVEYNPMDELSEQEARFVEAYVVSGVGVKAARAAGYSAKGAYVQGSRLLQRPRVLDAIRVARAELSKRTKLSAELIEKLLMAEAAGAEKAADRIRAAELLGKRLTGFFAADQTEALVKLSADQKLGRLLTLIADGKRKAEAKAAAS